MTVAERFLSKFVNEPNTGCWLWTDSLYTTGYGKLRDGKKIRRAHRVSWEQTYGPIPDGLLVLHRCDTRSCVNPAHLWLGTNQDNLSDAARKGRMTRGVHNNFTRLTEDQVLAIRRSSETLSVLSARYGVGRSTVQDVRRGRTWGWLVDLRVAVLPVEQP